MCRPVLVHGHPPCSTPPSLTSSLLRQMMTCCCAHVLRCALLFDLSLGCPASPSLHPLLPSVSPPIPHRRAAEQVDLWIMNIQLATISFLLALVCALSTEGIVAHQLSRVSRPLVMRTLVCARRVLRAHMHTHTHTHTYTYTYTYTHSIPCQHSCVAAP